MLAQLRADESECINKTGNILVRPDPTGIEKVRPSDLVPLEQAVQRLGRRRGVQEPRIGSAVDHTYTLARYCQQVLYISPSGIRDRNDTAGAQQTTAESI